MGTFASQGAVTAVRAFWNTLSQMIPLGVKIDVDPVVAQLDEATGQQNDEFVVGTPPAQVVGGGTADRAAPAGLCVNWKTSTFVSGRRLRGRTFVVPLMSGAYESDGTIKATYLTAARDAAAALLANGATSTSVFVVWHRPIGGAGGSSGTVTGASVNDRVAVLTSRRG